MGLNWVPEGVFAAWATSIRKLLDPKSTAATRSAEFTKGSNGLLAKMSPKNGILHQLCLFYEKTMTH
jgi:hypothetical protein